MELKTNFTLYRRMLGYMAPHLHLAVLGILFILLFTVSSSVGIFTLKPLFDGILTKSKADLIQSEKNATPGHAMTYAREFGALAYSEIVQVVRREKGFKQVKNEFGAHFNGYLRTGSVSSILMLTVFMIVAGVGVKCFSEYSKNMFFLRLNLRIMKRVRMDIYEKVMGFSMPFFNEYKIGFLMNRIINEVGIMQSLIITTASAMITNIAQVLFFFVILIVMDVKLTLILMLCFPPLVYMLDKVASYLKGFQSRLQNLVGTIMSVVQETLTGIRLVIASNKQKYEVQRYEKAVDEFQSVTKKLSKFDFLAAPLSEFVTTIICLGIVVYALKSRVMNPESSMTSGDFVVYVAFMFSMMRPIKALNSFLVSFQKGMVVAGRVYDILDRDPIIKNSDNAVTLTEFKDSIEFRNVVFSYARDKQVLKGINLTIKRGEIVALVGSSGGGKTTLVDLLPRLYDPDSGEVIIDGRNISEYTLESLRDRMGVVTQETILFHDTVRNNIAYGSPAASLDDLRKAAAVANALDFIEELPNKWDTIIGERGTLLSGGQRQRLCIARAVLRNPDILIFDEATSALDNESEAKVQEAIDNLIKNRTAIVIAHRLSTIRRADNIVVVDNGSIAETGTHDDLMKNDGIYKRLYNLQFRDRAWG